MAAPARNAAVITGRVDFTVATDSGKLEGEKAGLKTIIDMAKLKIPFQFSCTVTTGRIIRQNPDVVRHGEGYGGGGALLQNSEGRRDQDHAEIYSRTESDCAGGNLHCLQGNLVEDAYPTLEGLKNTLEIQASFDPKAAKAKVEDFVVSKASGLRSVVQFFSALCAMLFALCPSAPAQQPKKIPRIGVLGATSPATIASRLEAFRQGLREVGYVEGKNILIGYRYADGKLDRVPALAAEMVRLNVEVILTGGSAATRPARKRPRQFQS